MLKAFTRTALIVAAASGAAAGPASAATGLCIPRTAGQAVFSGGDNPSTYCAERGAKTALMPDSAADQQKLIDLLPYVTYKASGVGKKPTLVFTGLNIQISKKEYPGYGNTDGTGNLLVGDSGMRASDQSITDGRYSGSENLIVGTANTWRGRANVIVGENNKADSAGSMIQGLNNAVTGYSAFVAGNNQSITGSYKVIADGAGRDVKWVRYDAAGKVVASSEPQTGDAYYYGSSSYSLTKFNGVDVSSCVVSAQSEGPDGQVTAPIASPYYGYIYARFTKPTAGGGATYATGVPHTVTAVCNKDR